MKSTKTYGERKIDKINIEETIKRQFEEFATILKKELILLQEVNALVLFGSFARGDFSVRHSDIDLMFFLDNIKKSPTLEERIRKKVIELTLRTTLNIHTIFQYRDVKDEDQSLMRTISKEGKVLFSRKTLIISDALMGLKEYSLLKFDSKGVPAVDKNKLQRFLHGYTMKGKKYKGIVDGERVIGAGKGAVLVHQDIVENVILFAQEIGIKTVMKGKWYR